MRRNACLALLTLVTPLTFTACHPIVVGGGDGGGGGSSTTTTSTTSTVITGTTTGTGSGTTGTWTFTGTDGGCSEQGGVCAQYVPDVGCPDGVWTDWANHVCSGDDANCCLPVVCTPGADQTCNSDPTISSYAGHCEDSGICTCYAGHEKVKDGKCL